MITLREDKLSDRANYVIERTKNKSELLRNALEIYIQLLDLDLIEEGKLKKITSETYDMDSLKKEISSIKKMVEEIRGSKKVESIKTEEDLPENKHLIEEIELSTDDDDIRNTTTEDKKDQGLLWGKKKFPSA